MARNWRWDTLAKHGSNPVLAPSGWDVGWTVGGCVLEVDGTKYIYYEGGGQYNREIGVATSADGVTWSKYGSNPIVLKGASGTWDDNFVTDADVMKVGDIWKMWYSGQDGSQERIGYATSPDGLVWTKHAGNPVLSAGSSIWQPSVVLDGSTYKMWYGTNGHGINLATSPDGITWTNYGSNPVMTHSAAGQWDDSSSFGCSVLLIDGTYHMVYTGRQGAGSSQYRCGYAWSTDGINWTKYQGNPIISWGASGAWDDYKCSVPILYQTGPGAFNIYYSGHNGADYVGVGLVQGTLSSMAGHGGANGLITITSDHTKVAANMPDGGVGVFPGDFVIDEANSINDQGGARSFIDNLGTNELQVTQSDGQTTVPFNVKAFSQTPGSRMLALGLGLPALSGSAGSVYHLYRGCGGGPFGSNSGVYPTASNVQGAWPLEEASGNLEDWTANLNHGTRYLCAQQAAQIANGQRFTGVDGCYIAMGDTASLDITGAMTISVWVYSTQWTQNGMWIAKYGNTGHMSFYLGVIQDKVRFLVNSTGATAQNVFRDSSADLTDSTWHHIVGVYVPSSNLDVYINGTIDNGALTGSIPAAIYNSDEGFSIGRRGGSSHLPFTGDIDEAIVSNAARSGDWIDTYHEMTRNNNAFWTVSAETLFASGSHALNPGFNPGWNPRMY